jgi:type VI secretion system protein ImpH
MRTERWWQEASVIDELFKTPTAFEFIQTTRLFRHAPNTAVLKIGLTIFFLKVH